MQFTKKVENFLIKERNKMKIIMVTHEDDIASHAQRTIKLFDGKITEDAETNSK